MPFGGVSGYIARNNRSAYSQRLPPRPPTMNGFSNMGPAAPMNYNPSVSSAPMGPSPMNYNPSVSSAPMGPSPMNYNPSVSSAPMSSAQMNYNPQMNPGFMPQQPKSGVSGFLSNFGIGLGGGRRGLRSRKRRGGFGFMNQGYQGYQGNGEQQKKWWQLYGGRRRTNRRRQSRKRTRTYKRR